MKETLTNFWFWWFCLTVAYVVVDQWKNRELLRLRELRLKALEELIVRAEVVLSDRIETVKNLENLTPAEANRVWELIKNRVVQNWWPKDKEKGGGN